MYLSFFSMLLRKHSVDVSASSLGKIGTTGLKSKTCRKGGERIERMRERKRKLRLNKGLFRKTKFRFVCKMRLVNCVAQHTEATKHKSWILSFYKYVICILRP